MSLKLNAAQHMQNDGFIDALANSLIVTDKFSDQDRSTELQPVRKWGSKWFGLLSRKCTVLSADDRESRRIRTSYVREIR